MEDKDLDKLFREAFVEAEETPHADTWAKIEANLNPSSRIKTIYSFKNIGMIAASFTLICLGGYYATKIYNTNDANSTLKKENVNTIVHNNEIDSQSNPDNSLIKEEKGKNNTATNLSGNTVKFEKPENLNIITVANKGQKIELDSLKEKHLALNLTQSMIAKKEELVIIQVTEIDDIKPLIQFEDEEETMLANTAPDLKENKNIVTTVLNKLSENLDPSKEQTVRFIPDEEGSFAISIINSFAKNRNKKRK